MAELRLPRVDTREDECDDGHLYLSESVLQVQVLSPNCSQAQTVENQNKHQRRVVALCEKFVVSQHRIMEGTDPRIKRPRGGSGVPRGESSSGPPIMKLVSSPKDYWFDLTDSSAWSEQNGRLNCVFHQTCVTMTALSWDGCQYRW